MSLQITPFCRVRTATIVAISEQLSQKWDVWYDGCLPVSWLDIFFWIEEESLLNSRKQVQARYIRKVLKQLACVPCRSRAEPFSLRSHWKDGLSKTHCKAKMTTNKHSFKQLIDVEVELSHKPGGDWMAPSWSVAHFSWRFRDSARRVICKATQRNRRTRKLMNGKVQHGSGETIGGKTTARVMVGEQATAEGAVAWPMAMATSYGSFCFLLVGGLFGGWCWSTVILLCFFYNGCTLCEAMDRTSLLGAQTEIGQYFSLHLRCAGIWSIDDVALSFCWRRWNEGRSFSMFHLSRSFALVRPGFCFCLVWFLVWLWLCLVVGVACVLCCVLLPFSEFLALLGSVTRGS